MDMFHSYLKPSSQKGNIHSPKSHYKSMVTFKMLDQGQLSNSTVSARILLKIEIIQKLCMSLLNASLKITNSSNNNINENNTSKISYYISFLKLIKIKFRNCHQCSHEILNQTCP